MSNKINVVEVNGISYDIQRIPATKSIVLGQQLAKVFVPLLKRLQNATPEQPLTAGDMIDGFLENIDLIDVEAVTTQLGAYIYRGGKPVDFDNEFAGDFGQMFLVLREVVEFNFSGILSAIR